MAETKYDLFLVPTVDNSRVKPQPWYRERLKTKYDKQDKNKQWQPSLSTSAWTFIKDGLDDFRDGGPPPISDSIILKGIQGLSPNIVGKGTRAGAKLQESVPNTLSKEDQHLLRALPQQNRARERVKLIESSLMEHPLALFPHLEESVAPDVFEDIVELLDPALNLSDVGTDSPRGSLSEGGFHITEEEESIFDLESKPSSPLRYSTLDGRITNPYEWVSRDSPVEEKSTTRMSKKRTESLSQNENIGKVTHEFCEWVRDLGGDTNNIEESTIHSLFASGYETKPTLSVPLHVVELTNVPPELRSGTSNPTVAAEPSHLRAKQKASGYTPSWVKVKYGAWYLDPNTWKVMAPGQSLQDPKIAEENRQSEAKQKAQELDKVLTGLHGAKAFKDFVDKKGVRKPEFLELVNNHPDQQNFGRSDNTPSIAQEHPVSRESRSRSTASGSRRRPTVASSKE